MPSILDGLAGKLGSGNKDPLGCAHAHQASDKFLNIRPTNNRVRISFGLHVNTIQAEPILVDDAVHTAIARAAKLRGGVGARSAVAHLDQQIDDQPFKERRSVLQYSLQKLSSKCRLDRQKGLFYLLL